MSDRLRKLATSRTFWIGLGTVTASSLIFYDWYIDRYATPLERYHRIEGDYLQQTTELRRLRKRFLREIESLFKDHDPKKSKKSDKTKSNLRYKRCEIALEQLKFDKSESESSIFYIINYSNDRQSSKIIRIESLSTDIVSINFSGAINVNSDAFCNDLATNLLTFIRKCDKQLYSDINNTPFMKKLTSSAEAHNLIDDDDDNDGDNVVQSSIHAPNAFKVALCYSCAPNNLNNFIGKNSVTRMNDFLDRNRIPARAYVNMSDAAAILVASMGHKRNTQMSVILDPQRVSAAYIEPLSKEIVTLEWGDFNNLLPRKPTDFIMDEYTVDIGRNAAQKMICSDYLGELVRLLSIEVFRERITDLGANCRLNIARNDMQSFPTAHLCAIIEMESPHEIKEFMAQNTNTRSDSSRLTEQKGYCIELSSSEAHVFQQLCVLIFERSADMVATYVSSLCERVGLFETQRKDDRNPFESDRFVLKQDFELESITVAIQSELCATNKRYQTRLLKTLSEILSEDVMSRLEFQFFPNDSNALSKGAALTVTSLIQ